MENASKKAMNHYDSEALFYNWRFGISRILKAKRIYFHLIQVSIENILRTFGCNTTS